ncbi:MAG: hypothetical protein K7J15_06220, partial [Candidatus Regiella insecticola]|nr:hypothetical protein [Candidatus Regiella insecticola]MCX2960113.1 hypothetical protein [Serratia symbiotica]
DGSPSKGNDSAAGSPGKHLALCRRRRAPKIITFSYYYYYYYYYYYCHCTAAGERGNDRSGTSTRPLLFD